VLTAKSHIENSKCQKWHISCSAHCLQMSTCSSCCDTCTIFR